MMMKFNNSLNPMITKTHQGNSKWHKKKVENFLKQGNENREIHKIPVNELDSLMANFIIAAKKKDGSDYKPTTLRGIISSIDRKTEETQIWPLYWGWWETYQISTDKRNSKKSNEIAKETRKRKQT